MIEFDSIEAQRRTGGKLVLACNAAMVALTPLASLVAGNAVAKLAGIATVLALVAFVAYRVAADHFGQRLVSALVLVGQVALFVLAFSGSPLQSEARMAFLAALALLVAYGDWRIIAAGAFAVAACHGAAALVSPHALGGSGGLMATAFAIGVTAATAWSLIWMTAGVSRLFSTVSVRTRNAERAAEQAEEAREAVVAERNAREQSVAERAALKAAMEAEQNLVVTELDAAITKLADGDLSWRLQQSFAERYEDRSAGQLQPGAGATGSRHG